MDLLLLPELLLMASLSLLLAFLLARLISVAATAPSPSSSEDDRPLLHATAAVVVNRAASVGAGPGTAGEGELGEQRQEAGPQEENRQEHGSAALPLVPDSGFDDRRALDDSGRWRDVEIVRSGEVGQTELSGSSSSDEAAGVVQPKDHETEQGDKKGVREIHLTSSREVDDEEGRPRPTPPTEEDDDVRTEEQDKPKPTSTEEQSEPKPTPPAEDDDVGTAATATAITTAIIAPPGEGPPSEEVRPSDPGALAKAETTAVQVQQVKAVVPGAEGSSSDADDNDDDWEGIEASDLRNLFAVAASFVASPAGIEAISKLPVGVQLQLHGLHKAATEGPCFEAQPMPLKLAARAKWHAWQKLGDMNPEVAMEQYITVLSDKVPGWMVNKPNEKSMECEPSDSSEQHQPLIETESRKPEFN